MAGERCKRCGWVLGPARHVGSPGFCPPCLHALKSQGEQREDSPVHAWPKPPSEAVRQFAIKQVLRTVAIHLGIIPFDPHNAIIQIMLDRGYRVHIARAGDQWVATAEHPQCRQSYIARAEDRDEVLTAIASLMDPDFAS